MTTNDTHLTKPLLRGHFHQAAFFFALGVCTMLLTSTHDARNFISALIYSLSLTGLFGISALYHRPTWSPAKRAWMRKLDHAAIYIMIAGTGTPIFLLAFPEDAGTKLLITTWVVAIFGSIQSLFWAHAPKWISVILYSIAGCIVFPYFKELGTSVGMTGVTYILLGGFFYIIGGIIYAVKRPNPWPKTFGYHEIFHILVIVGAVFHFLAVNSVIQ